MVVKGRLSLLNMNTLRVKDFVEYQKKLEEERQKKRKIEQGFFFRI